MPRRKSDEEVIDDFIAFNRQWGDEERSPLQSISMRPAFGRKYQRDVILVVGDECTVEPLNPQAKKHRDRRCTILAFAGEIAIMPSYAVVRFIDTSRMGKVSVGDLVPRVKARD